MKRAVLLGTAAFPPIIRLWMDMFKTWQDEVDVAYLAVDHWYDRSVRDFIYRLASQFPKIVLLDVKMRDVTIGWPNSYNEAFRNSKEDVFLIMHDDTLVYKKGVVSKYFDMAQQGTVAAPSIGIYEPRDIVDAAIQAKYGWNDSPYSFLLYFLFISRENLEKTSMDFNVKGWNVGDDIPLLGIKNSPTTVGGDTGFLLGLELFDKHVPFYRIPRSETASLSFQQENVISLLIQWMKDKEHIFKEGWLHLQNTGNTIPLWFTQDLDSREWHKNIEKVRLAWLYTMMQFDYIEIPEFNKRLHDVFSGVMLRCGLEIDEIQTISNIFHILLYG